MNGIQVVVIWICMYGERTLAEDNNEYTNIWVAKVRGGEEVAKRIAKDFGYNFKDQLGEFKEYYKLVKEDHPEVSLRDSDHLTHSLLDLDEVIWAKQQMWVRPRPQGLWEYTEEAQREEVMRFLKKESKRSYMNSASNYCTSLFSCIFNFPTRIRTILKSINQGDIKKLGTFSTTPAPRSQLNEYSATKTRAIGLLSKKISAYSFRNMDPYWEKQWYMQDYRTVDMPVMDLNVVPAHKMGITGKEVTVAVCDIGVQHDHPEYKDNFVSDLSYDFCTNRVGYHDCDISHGTKCAGIIAMKPNNNLCGVGIAYDAKLVDLTLICSNKEPEYTAPIAFSHMVEFIDIYSNSWGNPGYGVSIHFMGHLLREALTRGVTKGRGGKGVIYVRSSGNDGVYKDNCAVDEHVNNEFVVVIAGAEQYGKPAFYSERCTAVFATTYTKSSNTEGIVATDLNGGCYADFSGTSAACPQGSAIIALALDANSDLTYRDVMHLISMSAEVAPLADNDGIWYKNGRGFWVSNAFGFGLMNAGNMVTLAKTWQNVPKKSVCLEIISIDLQNDLSHGSDVEVSFDTTACKGSSEEVNYLEHVELTTIVTYRHYRGGINIFLISPAETTSELLPPRPGDKFTFGLRGLTIISTHNWGENPRGRWTVLFKISSKRRSSRVGQVTELSIKFHGTKDKPAHYKSEGREYAAFRLPNGETS